MYQVLARKYRPKNFHQLLGQEHVATALTNAINHQRLHHAYLFTGTRGVGKTTIARILAKCLNCETGITSEPCGVCSTCVAIDAGRFIDLIEIDAASRTKVEDTRELLDNVPYAPTQGRYKVYLIDEVHMLSTHSFNALLKTLEEPPEHVKFLLATTDPQKLPITIISRCLQFVLRPLPQPQLADYLGKILAQEQIVSTPDALWQLASSAKGSVRDALSLTDQAIAFGNGQISDHTLQQMLGLIDQADVIRLLTFIYGQNTQAFAQAIQQLREQVVDAKAVFDRLAEVLHQVALLQILPDFDLQVQRQQQQALQQLARELPAELVQLYYEIVIKSRENISLANTPAQALEMCLLRMVAFKPLQPHQVTTHQPSSQTVSQNLDLPSPADVYQNTDNPSVDNHSADNQINNPAINTPVSDNQAVDNQTLENQAVEKSVIENSSAENQIAESQTVENFPHLPMDENIQSNEQNLVELAPLQTQQSVETTLDKDFANHQVEQTEQAQFSQQTDQTHLAIQSDNQFQPDNQSQVQSATQISVQPTSQSTSQPISQSPLDLLLPEVQTMAGEWTVEKWDYWVAQAREQGWLGEDDLILAKLGVMTGTIGGESKFMTDEAIFSDRQTFANLQQKIQRQLTGTTVSLEPAKGNLSFINANKPEVRQQQRETHALKVATEQISSEPVLQALLNQNASVSLVKFNIN